MTRRAPPTALRLIPGPTPPRNFLKHTLPSVPRPTFHEPSFVARAPTQTRQRRSPPQIEEVIPMLSVVIPAYPTPSPTSASSSTSSTSSSSTTSSSSESASFPPPSISRSTSFSPSSRHSPFSFSSSYSSPITRGPWDHSGSIPLTFNVETVLKPLEPVAMGVNISAGRC